MTISIGSAEDGVGAEDRSGEDIKVSIVRALFRSADEMSCRSVGGGEPSLVVEETVEPEGDEERFDEPERFRWLYL
jgi:hypothetical protein